MTSVDAHNISVVRAYWDGCNSGDVEELKATMASDVVHYFLPTLFPAIRGAEHLAKFWRKCKQTLNPIWRIDHLVARADEVVIEWIRLWIPPGSQRRLMNRGTEWYVMRNGRIAGVRAHFIADPNSNAELSAFPYAERGYFLREGSA